MRRRHLLAGIVGTTALGAGGLYVGPRLSDDATEPVAVETLAAPGSEAGTVTVPPADRPLVLEFFATTCSVCADQMSTLATARQRLDASVKFLSVTSEPVGLSVTRDNVREWWRAHDGRWSVGLDDGTTLAERYEATRVPTTLVLDAVGEVAWRHTGRFDAARLVEAVTGVVDR